MCTLINVHTYTHMSYTHTHIIQRKNWCDKLKKTEYEKLIYDYILINNKNTHEFI